MVAAGILREDEPVELIDGRLIAMPPQGSVHRTLTVVLRRLLESAYGDAVLVQSHSPIDAGPVSMPEPDLAVVRGDPRALLDRHPAGRDTVLAVEIAYSSQAIDRAKASVYARAEVPVYWLLDVPARRLSVYAEPRSGEYALTRVIADDETAPLPELADRTLAVADMLP